MHLLYCSLLISLAPCVCVYVCVSYTCPSFWDLFHESNNFTGDTLEYKMRHAHWQIGQRPALCRVCSPLFLRCVWSSRSSLKMGIQAVDPSSAQEPAEGRQWLWWWVAMDFHLDNCMSHGRPRALATQCRLTPHLLWWSFHKTTPVVAHSPLCMWVMFALHYKITR